MWTATTLSVLSSLVRAVTERQCRISFVVAGSLPWSTCFTRLLPVCDVLRAAASLCTHVESRGLCHSALFYFFLFLFHNRSYLESPNKILKVERKTFYIYFTKFKLNETSKLTKHTSNLTASLNNAAFAICTFFLSGSVINKPCKL